MKYFRFHKNEIFSGTGLDEMQSGRVLSQKPHLYISKIFLAKFVLIPLRGHAKFLYIYTSQTLRRVCKNLSGKR